MEKKNIFMALGAVVAAVLGKKVWDKRSGSNALYFPSPKGTTLLPDPYPSDDIAFYAWKQRQLEGKPDTAYNQTTMLTNKRSTWMKKYSPSKKMFPQYEPGGAGDTAYENWEEMKNWKRMYSGTTESGFRPEDPGSSFGSSFGSDFSEFSENESGFKGGRSESFGDVFGYPDIDSIK
jgi:hypothetical protein